MIAEELGDCRDIMLHSRSCSQTPLQRIQDTHRSYDPRKYPLLFVRGEEGYDLNMKDRLRFIRLNQTKLRAEDHSVLLEAVRNDNNVTSENLGKLVVLSSSFTGGPRYMHEYAQDGMTYVRHRGTPDLFITFTCNPNWSETTVELLPGQVAADRVDLVARVFQQKVKK
ncbi:helitron_like_N domain-containing protein [Trichonephila clavipes]|nr:helitron_like_N domain-containing protein [Trichonephila clavipes]